MCSLVHQQVLASVQRSAFFTRKAPAPRAVRVAAMATVQLSQDELKKQVAPAARCRQRPPPPAPPVAAAHSQHTPTPFITPCASPLSPLQAAWKAVDYVKSGMVVGLGTGSTAAFAVDRIGELLKSGELKDIVGVPTSVRTYEQALSEWQACCSVLRWHCLALPHSLA